MGLLLSLDIRSTSLSLKIRLISFALRACTGKPRTVRNGQLNHSSGATGQQPPSDCLIGWSCRSVIA